jgi:hypothetical protein
MSFIIVSILIFPAVYGCESCMLYTKKEGGGLNIIGKRKIVI